MLSRIGANEGPGPLLLEAGRRKTIWFSSSSGMLSLSCDTRSRADMEPKAGPARAFMEMSAMLRLSRVALKREGPAPLPPERCHFFCAILSIRFWCPRLEPFSCRRLVLNVSFFWRRFSSILASFLASSSRLASLSDCQYCFICTLSRRMSRRFFFIASCARRRGRWLTATSVSEL